MLLRVFLFIITSSLRHKNYKKLIDNYKDTIANIAKNKIETICYNFMPIVDWTRTQLDFQITY